MIRKSALLALSANLSLCACDLAPHYVRPSSATPPEWPGGTAYPAAAPGDAGMPWRTLIGDIKLRSVIDQAIANNRDLRAAIANAASARAQYGISRSARFPTIVAGAGATLQRGLDTTAQDTSDYSTDLGISSLEIDLFGRLRNESRAAFDIYLSTESGVRSTRLVLVAETASAYATLASDCEQLRIAQDTEASGRRSLELTQSLLRSGLTDAGSVQDAVTVVEQAKSDVENDRTIVAQDRNALELLVGAPVDDSLLPGSLSELDDSIAAVPAGLSSNVLLARPDILEAEYRLKSDDAAIGAARAAFFPTITLTAAVGVASSALTSLFTGGALNWSVSPSASLPILGGPNKGNLRYAKARRDYDLALYQKSIQQAFRDVADGLARRGTITRQRAAEARLVLAASRAYFLADARYRAGSDGFLAVLTAQRVLYASRRSQADAALVDIRNRIALYQAIGADPSL